MFGAIIQCLRLTNYPYPLVLGLHKIEDYLDQNDCLGAIIGRVTNCLSDKRKIMRISL